MSDLRYFQFLAGERQGEVLVFEQIVQEDEMTFVEFKDKSRCNEELILPLNDFNHSHQLMAEVSDHNNVWKFKTEWKGRQEEKREKDKDGEYHIVQPFIKGKKHTTLIPPRKVRSKFGAINKNIESPPPTPTPVVESKPKEPSYKQDPVYLMLNSSKKFETNVDVSLVISLPKKNLYEVINESFEEGGDKMIDFIINDLDITLLKKQLKAALKEAYSDNVEIKIEEAPEKEEYIEKETINEISYFEPEVIEEPTVSEPIMQKENENNINE